MLVGARNAMLVGGGGNLTAKDYIIDAALYDWDGIENFSFGVRNETINFWQDLISAKQITPRQAVEPSSIAGTTPDVKWAPTGWLSVLEECGGGQCDDAALISTSAFSVEFVFSNYGTNAHATPIRTRVGDSTNGFQVNIPPGLGYANPIFFKPGDIQNNVQSANYLAFTSTGSNITIYGDGVFRKTVTISASQMSNYLINRKPLKIGAYNVDMLTAARGQLNGIIHAIRSHSRALTADEIAANYAVDKARFGLP